MVRTVVGFAAFALAGILVLKLVFGLLGFAFSILMTLLVWAAIGFGIYLVIKVISPDTARRVREMVTGRSDA
jgi:hypothetical protein